MKRRVFLIHGFRGDPQGAWRLWLQKELEKKEYEVILPAMPNPDKPTCEEWVGHLKEVIGKPKESDILVGHSLGCIAVLRYIETLKEPIRCALLVAGFGRDLGNFMFRSFTHPPLDFEKVKDHCQKFILLHSDNDQYIPLKEGYYLEEQLSAELIIKKGMGHFRGDEGVTELPILYQRIISLS